jgi:tRNA modification GTPase
MYGGAFSKQIEHFQAGALHASALVEAALDFDDEDDVDGRSGIEAARAILTDLHVGLLVELDTPPVERLRDGIRLVIAGPVNSGKSTLLNRLVGWEAAIVTDIAGTTRDRIEVPVALGGTAYVITDTAGFRDGSDDIVERIGMDRAREAIVGADILLWLGAAHDAPRDDAIRIWPQSDRHGRDPKAEYDIAISALTGEGMPILLDIIAARADHLLRRDRVYLLSGRQRDALFNALAATGQALAATDPLLIAEDVRAICGAFDVLTGRASTEDMLDNLFTGFCIGK